MILFDAEDKSSPLKNCIRNNFRHLKKWATRTNTSAFRIYDKDIKEYPLAIDFYEGRFCLHLFSEEAPGREEKEARFCEEVEAALAGLFHVEKERLFWRIRKKRERCEQYEKVGVEGHFFTVKEYGIPLLVNLEDYLDTGLFLDHRETRRLVGTLSKGKKVLNLFCYTGAFTVHAALGGASFSKSVDLSNTYLDWAKRNFALSGLSLKQHQIVREDCLKFLREERELFDLIIIDPPTLSRSKKMETFFDIQEDYPFLIEQATRLLSPGGEIFFSTNSRRFVFNESQFEDSVKIVDISKKTQAPDFRDSKMRRCWRISY